MILRFHRELYREQAIAEAIGLYDRFARIEREDEPDYVVVRIAASTEERSRLVADELGNYALGLTIRDRQRSA